MELDLEKLKELTGIINSGNPDVADAAAEVLLDSMKMTMPETAKFLNASEAGIIDSLAEAKKNYSNMMVGSVPVVSLDLKPFFTTQTIKIPLVDKNLIPVEEISATSAAPAATTSPQWSVISVYDKHVIPATQKAKGMRLLGLLRPLPDALYPDGKIIRLAANVSFDPYLHGLYFPFYGRPAPKTPRHGFVESREINSHHGLKDLIKETLEADPEAELIVMMKIDAVASAIYVAESGALIIGPSNDGATAGRDSITLPIAPMTPSKVFYKGAGIQPGEHTYFELVASRKASISVKRGDREDGAYAVQARAGLPVDVAMTEYIPKKMVVQTVLEPTNDLLAWEKTCLELKGQEGVVAWIPSGSLACHAAIHCVAAGIPVLTRTARPEAGNTIVPDLKKMKPVKINGTEFRKGATLAKNNAVANSLRTSLGILHSVAYLKQSPHYSRLIGFALATIFRASAMACIAEARHYRKSKKSREFVYNEMLPRELGSVALTCARKTELFMSRGWRDGFGGYPWLTANVQTIKLWNRITAVNVDEAITEANKLVNMAHNNGWLLNKFLSPVYMDQVSANPGGALAAAFAPLYEVLTAQDVVPATFKTRKTRLSTKWSVDIHRVNGDIITLTLNGRDCHDFIYRCGGEEQAVDFLRTVNDEV